MVTKAGYDYAALQAANTVTVTLTSGVLTTPACNLVAVTCPIDCGQAKAGVNVNMIANPAKDKSVPYIVSFDAGAEEDVIDGDAFPTLTPDDITTLVANFSEGMQSSRSLKNNAVALAATCTVTVSTGGTMPEGRDRSTKTFTANSIISDYSVSMTSAGVMTITPTLKTAADWAAQLTGSPVYTGLAATTAWGSTATFTYEGTATYTVTLTTNQHLTDLSYIPWSIGTPGAVGTTLGVDLGFLHAWGEAYQDSFILGGSGSNIVVYIGE
jgi:hypothetical protein